MFDIGFWELAAIALVGLLVLGPERMPAMAARIGRWVGYMKQLSYGFREEIENELRVQEVKETFGSVKKTISNLEIDVKETLNTIGRPDNELQVQNETVEKQIAAGRFEAEKPADSDDRNDVGTNPRQQKET